MTHQHETPRIYAIIPAAGRSQRMGGAPKPLLRLGDRTMLECVVDPLVAAGLSGIAVVTTPAIAAALPAALRERIELVTPADPPREMIDSVRLGLRHWSQRGALAAPGGGLAEAGGGRASPGDAITAACGVLVCPADQPGIAAGDIRACTAAFAADPTRIIIATLAGRRGHPLIFPAALSDFVHSQACDAGLYALPRAHAERVTLVTCHSRGVVLDIDSPADIPDAAP